MLILVAEQRRALPLRASPLLSDDRQGDDASLLVRVCVSVCPALCGVQRASSGHPAPRPAGHRLSSKGGCLIVAVLLLTSSGNIIRVLSLAACGCAVWLCHVGAEARGETLRLVQVC